MLVQAFGTYAVQTHHARLGLDKLEHAFGCQSKVGSEPDTESETEVVAFMR
jgi:hypothetical protein